MPRRLILQHTCDQCGIRFGSSKVTQKFCNRRCAALFNTAKHLPQRIEQLKHARECYAMKRPKPDLSVFAVPVLCKPVEVKVELVAELPLVPVGIDHASRIMLGWIGARL